VGCINDEKVRKLETAATANKQVQYSTVQRKKTLSQVKGLRVHQTMKRAEVAARMLCLNVGATLAEL